MSDRIEFQNETENDFNVLACVSKTGQIYVHLLGDQEEIHDTEATTVESKDYAIEEINGRDRVL